MYCIEAAINVRHNEDITSSVLHLISISDYERLNGWLNMAV
jgi:hypothetical protein